MLKLSPRKPEIAKEEVGIVMIGDFNPKIFQPMWFSNQSLLRETEASQAEIELVHSDFTGFSTEWLQLQVSRDRFSAFTRSFSLRQHLADLVRGCFGKLSHTPITMMGVNYVTTINFKSTEDWHAFGHFLVPKTGWSKVLSKPGMQGVGVRGQRKNSNSSYVLVTGEPLLNTNNNDVVVRVNYHYELPSQDINGSEFFLKTLEESFDTVVSDAQSLINELLGTYTNTNEFFDGTE